MLKIKTYDPQCLLPTPNVRIVFKVEGQKESWYTGKYAYKWADDKFFFHTDDHEGYIPDLVSEWGYIE